MDNQKGVLGGGECARTICKNRDARWFNKSTQKYYCYSCAQGLNKINHREAMRLYNAPLCEYVSTAEYQGRK